MSESQNYSLNAPEETYSSLCDERQELQELFSQDDVRGDPLLVVHRGSGRFEVYPDKPDDYDPERPPPDTPASYDTDDHTLKMEAEDIADEFADYALRHELTHSVIGEDMTGVKTDSASFQDFDGYSTLFGRYSHGAFRELGIDEASIDPTEFFPALGVAYLQGENPLPLSRWEDDFRNYKNKAAFGDEQDQMMVALKVQDMSRHLPQMAGEMLVEQYDGDVGAILEEHPEILQVNEEELWEEFCVPILKNGELQ